MHCSAPSRGPLTRAHAFVAIDWRADGAGRGLSTARMYCALHGVGIEDDLVLDRRWDLRTTKRGGKRRRRGERRIRRNWASLRRRTRVCGHFGARDAADCQAECTRTASLRARRSRVTLSPPRRLPEGVSHLLPACPQAEPADSHFVFSRSALVPCQPDASRRHSVAAKWRRRRPAASQRR